MNQPPTAAQRNMLERLMLSSTFTAEEVHRVLCWTLTPKCTRYTMSKAIDKALERIKLRDRNKKDSEARRANYRRSA